jgi:hypothetical protein
MAKQDDGFIEVPSRLFKLEKDKYVSDVELDMYYDIKTGTYTESLIELNKLKEK